jgi:hypothetical protein
MAGRVTEVAMAEPQPSLSGKLALYVVLRIVLWAMLVAEILVGLNMVRTGQPFVDKVEPVGRMIPDSERTPCPDPPYDKRAFPTCLAPSVDPATIAIPRDPAPTGPDLARRYVAGLLALLASASDGPTLFGEPSSEQIGAVYEGDAYHDQIRDLAFRAQNCHASPGRPPRAGPTPGPTPSGASPAKVSIASSARRPSSPRIPASAWVSGSSRGRHLA